MYFTKLTTVESTGKRDTKQKLWGGGRERVILIQDFDAQLSFDIILCGLEF